MKRCGAQQRKHLSSFSDRYLHHSTLSVFYFFLCLLLQLTSPLIHSNPRSALSFKLCLVSVLDKVRRCETRAMAVLAGGAELRDYRLVNRWETVYLTLHTCYYIQIHLVVTFTVYVCVNITNYQR